MDWAVIFGHSAWAHPGWDVLTGAAMAVATFLLFVATRQLAKATKKQTAFLEKQTAFLEKQTAFLEKQERRELKLGYYTDHNGHYFGGFTLTNVGIPPITITGVDIALSIPIAADDKTLTQYAVSDWVTECRGKEVSNFQPPHRLLTGDRIRVLYDLDELGHDIFKGRRIRYECRDSFGDTYVSAWVQYSKSPHGTTVHSSPGEGFREPTMWGTVIRA